ncbi:unnamed protein product [Acanthoscelides obtectus]|uniref:Major facilitator superfamily (MFS) profile domain-containing protein n=1 Tax=Acanthoscelides obtectus TaxID=200917 RepID=A0A9P0NVG0_ACAOB|nr:unnamed protein product [Acanthoscelides obtectus]CAK1639814.1 Monocarboxylate transporter 5 [Acanthoscelides obtectus]
MAHVPIGSRKRSEHTIHKFQGKESFITSQVELYVVEENPKIPDGGWGWMVVLAAFVLNAVSEGVSFSFGLMYSEFLNEFKASKSATSWVGSLFLALALLAGTIVFAPLTTFLLNEFRWRGTMLILAGCFLNMCVCGVIMRDPDWIKEEAKEKKEKKAESDKNGAVPHANGIVSKKKSKEPKKKHKHDQFCLKNVKSSADLKEKDKFRSTIDLPTYIKEDENVPLEVLKQLSENHQMYQVVLENYPDLLRRKSLSNQDIHELSFDARVPVKFSLTIEEAPEPIPEEEEEVEVEENGVIIGNKETPLLKNSSFVKSKHKLASSHSYLNTLKGRKASKVSLAEMDTIQFSSVSSCPNFRRHAVHCIVEEEEDKTKKRWCIEFFKSLQNLLNLSLFLELHFLLLSFSTIILFVWFIVPYFYIAEHMKSLGYADSQASIVLSTIGLLNTIGMVFLGWAGDRLNIAKTYSLCLILCGLSICCIMFFADNYILLLTTSALFGLFFASCFSLLPSLLAELVPLEGFTMAYGLILLCEGVGNLTGPPLAGFLFDLTGSWNQSFYQAAIWIMVSGLLIGIIPFTNNKRICGSGLTLLQQEIRKERRANFIV